LEDAESRNGEYLLVQELKSEEDWSFVAFSSNIKDKKDKIEGKPINLTF
jgi:hypothetical protein